MKMTFLTDKFVDTLREATKKGKKFHKSCELSPPPPPISQQFQPLLELEN